MATIIADNILSPLGLGTQETLAAIMEGRSSLRRYDSAEGVPFAFTASLFSKEQNERLMVEGFTRFESLAIRSISAACSECRIDKANAALIISTTKGNVDLLAADGNTENVTSIGVAAKRIAAAVGVTTQPIVVCNACISGVAALVLAQRMIEAGDCRHAIVCGIDLQSPFIISGFQSLQALSANECRPFDIERIGLNLGEAAATVVLAADGDESAWKILRGAVKNDAYHVSTPHPQGEGCMRAIERVLEGTDRSELALVNAHGTATMYNDQMESKAISRAGLSEVPTNALKGYLGHTLGAAGVIEMILSMRAVDRGVVLATRGFDEIGVSGKVNVSGCSATTDKRLLLKIISGFGGCNGALLLGKDGDFRKAKSVIGGGITHRVRLTNSSLAVDGKDISVEQTGAKLLGWLYKQQACDYPKFYKMDGLAKLAFVATELLLNAEGRTRFADSNDRAVVLFSKTGSLATDKAYLATIADAENYYPSPSLFVYTLPNIAAGEIAIRNKCHAETEFYILGEKNQRLMDIIINKVFADDSHRSVIAGWVEYEDETTFEADLYILEKSK